MNRARRIPGAESPQAGPNAEFQLECPVCLLHAPCQSRLGIPAREGGVDWSIPASWEGAVTVRLTWGMRYLRRRRLRGRSCGCRGPGWEALSRKQGCDLEVREELSESRRQGGWHQEEANRSMGGLEIESGKGLEQV